MNLNQITIPSRDLSQAVEFYRKLGLELIVDSIPRYARFLCPKGTTTLSLHYVENYRGNSATVIYFECANLDEEVEKLKEIGIRFSQDPQDERWMWREARLFDPDNNQICLFLAGENRINPPWRVGKEG